ncbi:MAG TPA: NYN domain-containing protein [Sphingopyxis sp.]|nr:NYN domain-containing protein [Sphingopyxis sp.]HMP44684.1 NYN domain-containing protein [Sphingopyxis sp.]HMQ18133.1 NYN domain-containing protein [Sphingopyxis sp.]
MSREIAILIDGGFLTKRLQKLVDSPEKLTPYKVCGIIRSICREHVRKLTDDLGGNWHKHIYRIFYYDAPPFTGQAHHPLSRKQINYAKSDQAKFQNELFLLLKKQRNMALRLGHLSKLSGWSIQSERLVKLLHAKAVFGTISALPSLADGSINIGAEQVQEIRTHAEIWSKLEDWMVQLDLRQKGVDMRIGLDIAAITLKHQASTIILIAGDADFVPAAKLARREGIQFILDPLWQSVSDDLFEHIDGLQTVLRRPASAQAAEKEAKDPN